jgi:hypothetical protein
MRHTYLLEQGTWLAEGLYYDEAGEAVEVKGRSDISHEGDVWIIDSEMSLATDPPVSFAHRYRVGPLAEGAGATTWESESSALGRLNGTFAVVDEAILSAYVSEDGIHWGSECLRMIDKGRYRGHGALFRQGQRVSAFAVDLRREE